MTSHRPVPGDPKALPRLFAVATRRFTRHYARALWAIGTGAVLGVLLGGGFVWAWHGDWSSSANPLDWNAAAQSDFVSTMMISGLLGAGLGLVVSLASGPRRTR